MVRCVRDRQVCIPFDHSVHSRSYEGAEEVASDQAKLSRTGSRSMADHACSNEGEMQWQIPGSEGQSGAVRSPDGDLSAAPVPPRLHCCWPARVTTRPNSR